MKLVYADYAAATPVDPEVAEKVRSISDASFANPSSAHGFGHAAEIELTDARKKLAKFINAELHEIIFTSSGTESNNLALLGVMRASRNRGNHLVTTEIEHPSILNAARSLERDDFVVTYVQVKKNGHVDSKQLLDAITSKTILVSLHLANSEIGVIQDIAALAGAIKRRFPEIYIHVDACQATPFLKIDVKTLKADLLTFNGNKMYGPKGIAVLYVRSGVPIFPIVFGGGQEQSLRSGTENVPGAVGLAKAAEIIEKKRNNDVKKISELRDELMLKLEEIGCRINVKNSNKLPNHLSVTIPGLKNMDIVALLSKDGIGVSAGSACSSKSLIESHVLKAIGLTSEQINSTIRISLGRQTTSRDIDLIFNAIKKLAPKGQDS